MSLRPYQQEGVDEIRALYRQGIRKVLLHLATGGGKTVVFTHVLNQAAARGKKAIMVVRGRKLVEQASQRLFREKVEHGVRMSKHWNRNYGAAVQVCSIDTLIARKHFPPADIVVIDEVDEATSEGYKKLVEQYPNAFFLGVTATPYTNKSLRHVADAIVHPISVQGLIDLGFLVPPRYYAPSEPDLAGVKIVNNDYQSAQLEARMSTLTGDIVAHWKALGQDRPTICFAVSVAHSKMIAELFNASGISAEHCDADSSDKEREAILRRLESGETKVACNVGILCRGVDIPFLGCIIMARPTRSYNLYIQQAGRGTRPLGNKTDFILLDHAGNVTRHGYITVEPPADLDGNARKKQERALNLRTCSICYLVYEGFFCPDCGKQQGAGSRVVEVEEGRLRELIVKEEDPVLQFISHAKQLARKRKYKPGWIWHQVVERFGEDVAKKHAPSWFSDGFDSNPFARSPYRAVK